MMVTNGPGSSPSTVSPSSSSSVSRNIQDVRGQYTSRGFFYTFRNEARDGYDTVEWAAKLPGSNGKVGMYGFSYVGATQWLPATLRARRTGPTLHTRRWAQSRSRRWTNCQSA